MALILALELGEAFYVIPRDGKPHERFVLDDIQSPSQFTLRRASAGQSFDVTDERGAEVYPDVVVSAGIKGTTQTASVVLRADPEIKILREPIYKEWYG